MKKIVLSAMCLAGIAGHAQENVQVSTGEDYKNQSYYSFENGEVANVSNVDWDIAFDVSGFGSSIRINGQNEIDLYVSTVDTVNWSSSLDTANLATWTKPFDSDVAWSQGAFNADYDDSNPLDLGWGVYNSITHAVTGNKIFVVKS